MDKERIIQCMQRHFYVGSVGTFREEYDDSARVITGMNYQYVYYSNKGSKIDALFYIDAKGRLYKGSDGRPGWSYCGDKASRLMVLAMFPNLEV